jgi:predicted dehydrogenase
MKIGCIGTGYWGKNLVRNFAALEALKWICDAEPACLAPFAASHPQAQLTGEPDKVLNDPEVQAVFVNVVGDIRPEQLNALGNRFELQALRGIDLQATKLARNDR